MPEKRLSGSAAVITGSTGGMGEGIARRLAAEGAAVAISGRRESQGRAVADSIVESGGQALFIQADIGQERDCVALIERAASSFGRIDMLVNNAAATPVEVPGEQSAALWDEVFNVNARGAFLCCREAIPLMRRQGGGRIVNIGSTVPFRGGMNRLAYGCSKAALWAMTRMMARDLVRDRILVNWITVGWVATPGEISLRDQLHGDGMDFLERTAQQMPLGELQSVEDIAAAVAFLVSEEARHVTGCDLNVSGGLWI
jgi:NAD(P)-dependent dehydrogenase (short-subunit alcohol dehydrogenase family)